MKLNILQVVALCACLGQIHSWPNELSADQMKYYKESIKREIYNVSEQFLDDFIHISEMSRGDIHDHLIDLKYRFLNLHDQKMDAEYVRATQLLALNFEPVCLQIENIKILQSVFSKRMAPEQYNGLINLFYVCTNQNATSAQIESALNYLYGIDNAATRTSFLNPLDFPDPSAKDCPTRDRQYTFLFDKLRLTNDLRPKVIEDISAIREKFPCNTFVFTGLHNFILLITQWNDDKLKISACMLKENSGRLAGRWLAIMFRSDNTHTKDLMEYLIEGFEFALLTQVSDETGRGIINLLKANIPGTPIDEIEKALEYLYDSVPETQCTNDHPKF